jgi:hypothetical protein
MKQPPKPPNKRLTAAVKSPPKARAAAPDAQPDEPVNDNPRDPPLDTRAIAPLWDMPEQNIRIPLDVLQQTFVYRYILSDKGEMIRSHCGNLPPDATGAAIRRQWGGGRFFLQARVGSRVLAARDFHVDGPELQTGVPFGPIAELNSGLVTLNSDPQSAALFALFQMWMAAQRGDFQAILTMQQSVLEKLAGQFGASMVANHLKEQLASANGRVTALEKLLDEQRERERASEKEALRRKYKGGDTDWVSVVEAVGEIAPAVLTALPPKVKTFLEGLATDAGKALPGGSSSSGLPAGVTEPAG